MRYCLPLTILTVFLALASLADLFALPGSGNDVPDPLPVPVYDQLRLYRFSEEIAVPPGGLTLENDSAAWILTSGSIRLMEPTDEGAVTGLVFAGEGRFRMNIPDPVEQDQLDRFSGEELVGKVEEPFTELVLRTTGELPASLPVTAAGDRYADSKLARERHERWLKLAGKDIDSRITAGLLNRGDDYLWVEMDAERFDWMTFEFDNQRQEEIRLEKLWDKWGYREIWVSLDDVEDRLPDGRPSGLPAAHPVDITHLEIEADLTKCAVFDRPDYAEFKATVTFEPQTDGCRAFTFQLPPLAELSSVETVDGEPIPYVRDRIGKRFASLDRRLSTNSLAVIFDEPVPAGESRTFVAAYRMKILNYLSGRSWYPANPEEHNDSHTVRLVVESKDKHRVRAVGRQEQETVADKVRRSVWVMDTPVRQYGFTVGKRFQEETVALEGAPPVTAFGLARDDMMATVARDVAESLAFYQRWLEVEVPAQQVLVTWIDGGHGQSFPGFLHLPRHIFREERAGASALFRAHEAAHQLWGELVGWKSYRDQWLSEAFAEYSAMLFLEATRPDEDFFEEIVQVYANECLGSLEGGMSRFARPWNIHAVRREREHLGPVGVGHRASSFKIPSGYLIQAYHKGPLVLHMLRVILRNETGDDERFRRLLSEFLEEHAGGEVSTADFRAKLEQLTGRDWSWFFGQWVDGTHIPEYRWSHRVRELEDGSSTIEVTVSQVDAPEGFRMPVPLQVEFEDGTREQFVLEIDEPEKSFTFQLPGPPDQVTFNPGNAVLARVKADERRFRHGSEKQITHQNPNPDQDQQHPPGQLHPVAETVAKQAAEPQPDQREPGGDQPDQHARLPDGHPEHGQAQTHGQGVDTGGQTECHQGHSP